MSASPAQAPHIFSPAYYERLRAIEDRHWWPAGMRRVAEAMVRPFLPAGPLATLDAGCGAGSTLGWLRRLSGEPAHGVDLSSDAIAHCHRRGEPRTVVGSVLDLPYRDGSFDLVHSADVLQHLETAGGPRQALEECRRVLKAGGLLLLRTNARPGASGACGDRYQRFDRHVLVRMLADVRIDCLRLTYANCLPSLAAEVVASLPRRREPEQGDHGLRIAPYPPRLAWLNRAMLLVLRMEAWYVGRLGSSLPYGHTLLCVARRPR